MWFNVYFFITNKNTYRCIWSIPKFHRCLSQKWPDVWQKFFFGTVSQPQNFSDIQLANLFKRPKTHPRLLSTWKHVLYVFEFFSFWVTWVGVDFDQNFTNISVKNGPDFWPKKYHWLFGEGEFITLYHGGSKFGIFYDIITAPSYHRGPKHPKTQNF